MRIAIIGAGASGMAAALAASENPANRILLLERQNRVGRKLLATGNGRCNLTNLNADRGGFHSSQESFPQYAVQSFPPQAVLEYMEQLGLCTVAEPSGRVYPYSDQANSVVDVLRYALRRPNIELLTDTDVTKVKVTPEGFCLIAGDQSLCCDRLIIACGGLAGTKLGGSMSGYKLLKSLGHTVTKLRPALVQLRSGWSGVASLKGVRANCTARIVCNGETFSSGAGEIQFTDYGLSGPVIFEISRDACSTPGVWECILDLMPGYSHEKLLSMLQRKQHMDLPSEELLTGILHNRLGRVLVREAGIQSARPICQLTDGDLNRLCALTKSFSVSLTEPMGMDSAQVTAGGVSTFEFDPLTMESKRVSGLYACGEVLDVDGDCGGYNLQWAWSSGRLAGLNAGKERT